jgi:hypothetical protein
MSGSPFGSPGRTDYLNLVELRGFEPLTPSMRTRCATGLRYSPKNASQPSKRRHQLAPGDNRWETWQLAVCSGAYGGQSPMARAVASSYWS